MENITIISRALYLKLLLPIRAARLAREVEKVEAAGPRAGLENFAFSRLRNSPPPT